MRRRAFLIACFLLTLASFHRGSAQQGHPLTGTWNGDWGTSPSQRNQVTVVMTWDGKEAKAVINPGPDSSNGSVTLDPVGWSVRIEADVKDPSGKPAHLVADGRMEDIGNPHRTISGSWKQGATAGNFKLTRD